MNGSAIYTALPEHMAVNFPGKKFDLTDEIVAEFQNAVFSVKASAQVPDEIKTIITEDVTDLFNGVSTAEESIERIQSRLSIYLSERK